MSRIALILTALFSLFTTSSWAADLVEIKAGTAVNARVLEGESAHFVADGQRVFVHLTVASAVDDSVTMVWMRDGITVWSFDLTVGRSPRWRTWARRTMKARDVGQWTVQVLDADGAVLGSTDFQMTPTDASSPRAASEMPEEEFGC